MSNESQDTIATATEAGLASKQDMLVQLAGRVACAAFIGAADSGAWQALTADERALLSEHASPKRRDEFARGRWVAKQLLSRVISPEFAQNLVVLADSKGAPAVFTPGGGQLGASVSISHSRNVAVAAVCSPTLKLGIDVQPCEQRVLGIMRSQGTPADREWFDQLDEAGSIAQATMIWTVKEAVGKALGLPLMTALRKVELRAIGTELHMGWNELELSVTGGASHLRGWTRSVDGVQASVCVAASRREHLDHVQPETLLFL